MAVFDTRDREQHSSSRRTFPHTSPAAADRVVPLGPH